MRIPFYKMTGSGNDFILIDNRESIVDADRCVELVKSACLRKFSVGADGLILIEKDGEVDFRWRFFNADGSEAEMCGNGGRCAARFAYLKGIVKKPQIFFRTIAGIIRAEVKDTKVKLEMTPPESLETDFDLQLPGRVVRCNFVNTGVPHTVILLDNVNELKKYNVFEVGRTIRYHKRFQPAGTNVNFVVATGLHSMSIRTYERGVEDETLACGTGSIAGAIIGTYKGLVEPPVEMKTQSGETLTIYFDRNDSSFCNVFLEGDALVVYDGNLWDETIVRKENKDF
ncbi:MAG TPA: diaminopimelate epimerase [Deltaproteobacteria bacterium]|nr:diaminopimelate epimerase [Deltaproteobacteria bacterium]